MMGGIIVMGGIMGMNGGGGGMMILLGLGLRLLVVRKGVMKDSVRVGLLLMKLFRLLRKVFVVMV